MLRSRQRLEPFDLDTYAIANQAIFGKMRTQRIALCGVATIELELHRGSPSRLFEIALTLSDAISLWPGTRSKADRGYSLRTGERPVPSRAEDPELAGDATLRDAIVPIARAR